MNNNEIKKLTPQQALEQGYEYFTVFQSDQHYLISDLFQEWYRIDELKGKKLFLMSKENIAFSISAETIQGLLQDHIDNEEDFYDESERLYDELAEAEFEKIAELVNVGFKKRFMFPTEIELVTEDKEVLGG
jgi:hypothetical protein